MDSETIIESSFEYTDGKMYRTIKVTMPPCDTNDDAAWAERNDLAERIRALLQAPAPQPSDDVAKDAARYQWLVKHSTYGIDYRQRPELTLSIYAPDHRDGLSAAIDAAMGQGGSDE